MARILVVEDDPEVRQVIKLLLIDQGHDVIESTDGASAYHTVTSDRLDLILLDIMMPSMNGFELLQKLKSNPDTRDIPVIVVTARNQVHDEHRAMRSGAVDFISKPWAPGELEDRVRLGLAYQQSSTQRRAAASPQSARNAPERPQQPRRVRRRIRTIRRY